MKSFNLLFLFILVFVTACASGGRAGESTPTPVPTPIQAQKPTYTVQRGAVTRTLRLQGRVAPVQQQDLFFRADGFVQEVLVARGDVVKAGDVLARLDEPEKYASDIAAAQIGVEKAQHDLDELIRGAPVEAAEAQLALAEAEQALQEAEKNRTRLDYSRTSNELVVENAYTDYLLAKAALKAATRAYENVAHKKTTNPERVMALKALLAAQQQYDLAFAIWNWYQLPAPPAEIAQADGELAVAQAKYDLALETWEGLAAGPDPFEKRIAEASVTDAESQLEAAQKALEAIELRAPFDGEILSVGISPGSQVTAFRSVLTLADPGALEIVAFPSPGDLSSLGVDQAAEIQLTGRTGTTIEGHIRQVPFTGTFTSGTEDINNATGSQDQAVRITPDDPATALTLNEVATIVIQLEVREGVLWLPLGALRTFQGRDFVFIEENGVQRRADVQLGLRGADRVEILEGLSEGQVVVGP